MKTIKENNKAGVNLYISVTGDDGLEDLDCYQTIEELIDRIRQEYLRKKKYQNIEVTIRGWNEEPIKKPKKPKCIICGADATGLYDLGPCENGHTLNEQVAFADSRIKSDYQKQKCARFDERQPECEAEECDGYNFKCPFYETEGDKNGNNNRKTQI